MVKPYLSISLKDPQSYYMEDETISCLANFKSEKVLKEARIRVKFIGRSISFSHGVKQHTRTLFKVEKEIPIDLFNNVENIKKLNTVEFAVEVPNNLGIPSFKNLDSVGDGGKIEYMIEANLEASGFLKRSVLASHIISVPLVGKVNINDNGLERTRDSSTRWPRNLDDANTCVLYGWIPHEGVLRGCDIPIRVEYKQPDRYSAIKEITVSLVQQEIISSSKDSPPDMTKQLPDRIIKTVEKPAELSLDHYTNLLTTYKVIVFTVPSDITPSIIETGQVVRIDYKLRITVQIPNGGQGGDKELSINIPIVIGSTGLYKPTNDSDIYTSGSQRNSPLLLHQGLTSYIRNDSVLTGGGGVNHEKYSSQPIFPGMMNDVYPSPLGFTNPMNTPFYPPINKPNGFILNPQNLPFVHPPNEDAIKMPEPDFNVGNSGNPHQVNMSPSNPYVNSRPISPTSPLYPGFIDDNESDFSKAAGNPTHLSRLSSTSSKESSRYSSGQHSPLLETVQVSPSTSTQPYPSLMGKPNEPSLPEISVVHKPNIDRSLKAATYCSSLNLNLENQPTSPASTTFGDTSNNLLL